MVLKFLRKEEDQLQEKFKKILEKEKFAFSWLEKLKKEFKNSEVYLVGGATRDIVLNRETKDFDFVIRNISSQDLEKFLSFLGKVSLVGKAFGVFKFIPKNWDPSNPIDVALPRTEHAFGTGAYKDIEAKSNPKLSIEKDLSRRDFTINAIALKLDVSKNQEIKILKLVDPFKGLKDIKNKIIKAVGNPEERFKEDYSRMLRAIRFSIELNFKIEEKTWQAIKNNISHLNDLEIETKLIERGRALEPEIDEKRIVPYEVIAKEFLKSLKADPVKTFDLYDQVNLWQEIMPEILKMKGCPQPKEFHSEGDVWTHTRLTLEKLSSKEFEKEFKKEPPSLELILSALFHDIGKPYTIKIPEKNGVDRIRFDEHDLVGAELTEKICQRLRLSSPEKIGIDPKKVAWLVRNHMILIAGDISKMKTTTIEKYFFNQEYPSDDLLKLSFVDIAATFLEGRGPDFSKFYQMKKRINEIRRVFQSKKEVPRPLLNGYEIIEKFGLKPGPKIGQLLEKLREKQLSGKIKTKEEAFAYLAKIIKNSE